MKRLLALALALLASPAWAGVGSTANTAVGSSLILRTTGVDLYSVNVTSGASAGYVMVFDRTTVPADGAVTPALCLPLAANTGLDWNFRSAPVQLQTGAVIVFSTTGCFSKTASATAFIAGSIQ